MLDSTTNEVGARKELFWELTTNNYKTVKKPFTDTSRTVASKLISFFTLKRVRLINNLLARMFIRMKDNGRLPVPSPTLTRSLMSEKAKQVPEWGAILSDSTLRSC